MKKIIIILALICLPFLANAKININTASLVELDEGITGVGPAIAGKIIDYRNTNGPFKTIEEIKNVSGIGEVTFLKMKDEITVGSDSSSSSDTDNSSANQAVSDDTKLGSDSDSVHTSETVLSDYQTGVFKIGAGRERLATVRTPILFTASQNKKGKERNVFTWSFGDGTSAYGSKVYHTYQFPGRYNVVLNGSIDSEEEAVARTTVLVSEPKIKITSLDLTLGYVEISNDSDKEQNLNSWSLRGGQKVYVFPVDTIISSGTSIKIPLRAAGLTDPSIKEIILTYPDGGIISGASLVEGVDVQKIEELKKEAAKVRQQIVLLSATPSFGEINSASGLTSRELELDQVDKAVVILEKKISWLDKIKNAIFK